MKRLKFDKVTKWHYNVYNKTKIEHLGDIDWHNSWQTFVWMQDEDVIMSADCLQEVVDFIDFLRGRLK